MPKAAAKLAAAPSTPPASISTAPMAVPNSCIPTTSFPLKVQVQKQQHQSLIMEDAKREKPRQISLTNGLIQQNLEVGKLGSNAKSMDW